MQSQNILKDKNNENTITENDIMIDSSLQSTEKSLADRIQSGNIVATA